MPPADETGDHAGSPYRFTTFGRVDPDRLRTLAERTVGGTMSDPLSTWVAAVPDHLRIAAVHQPTGDVAAMCVGRPARWYVDGAEVSAIANCVWYVSPDHARRGLGQRVLAELEAAADGPLYAFSVSPHAISSYHRLGWTGPITTTVVARPIRWPKPRRGPGSGPMPTIDHAVITGGDVPDGLAARLDQLDADAPKAFRMRRDAAEWRWRSTACPGNRYGLVLAERQGRTVGSVVWRRPNRGRSRVVDTARAALVVDLLAADGHDDVLPWLVDAAAAAARTGGARSLVGACTLSAHRRAFARAGFVSSADRLFGRLLGSHASEALFPDVPPWRGFDPGRLALTWADSDVDLNL